MKSICYWVYRRFFNLTSLLQHPETNEDFIACKNEAEDSYHERMIEAEQLRKDAYAMLIKAEEISKKAENDYDDFIENCPCQEMVEIYFNFNWWF